MTSSRHLPSRQPTGLVLGAIPARLPTAGQGVRGPVDAAADDRWDNVRPDEPFGHRPATSR